ARRIELHISESGGARRLKPHAFGRACRSKSPERRRRTEPRWGERCGAGKRLERHARLVQHAEILGQQLAPRNAVERHFHVACRILSPLEVAVAVHDDKLVIGPTAMWTGIAARAAT